MIEFVENGLRERRRLRARRPRAVAACPASARLLTDEQLHGHHRVRAEPVMLLSSRCSAIGWEPELRGILIVIIAVVTLCGSVYLILATNLGARLGFLVALAGLAGWMMLIGLDLDDLRHRAQGSRAVVGRRAGPHGAAGQRRAVPGQRAADPRRRPRGRVVRPTRREIVARPVHRRGLDAAARGGPGLRSGGGVGRRVPRGERGVRRRRSSRPSPCTTSAASAGRRSTTSLDFLAFRHEPHYVVVEVAPLVRDADRAGPGAGAGRDRRDPASTSTSTWSATSVRSASRRCSSRSARASCSSRCAGCSTAGNAILDARTAARPSRSRLTVRSGAA